MNKPVLCLALAVMATPGVSADSTSAALNRLVDCSAIPGTRERLACFDQEIAPLAKARSASTAPGSTAALPSPAPTSAAPPTPATFGQEQLAPKLRPAEKEEEQTLHAHIAELRTAGTSNFMVTLDNGQVWRHEDVIQGGYLRKGEAITISKGALGSYRLTRDAGTAKNWIRVSRIR